MKNKIIPMLMLVIALTACSSEKSAYDQDTAEIPNYIDYSISEEISWQQTYDDINSIAYEPYFEASESYDDVATNQSTAVNAGASYTDDSKIVMTGDAYFETDDFDTVVEAVRAVAEFYDGYTSNSSLYRTVISGAERRRYLATLKIPSEHFKKAFERIMDISGLKTASQQQENVGEQYTNTESRLATRKIEEERLLGMIAGVSEIDELLSLERRLAQVRTDISLYESQLKNIDMLVAYSTINILVYESDGVVLRSEESFVKRLINGFKSSALWILNLAQSVTYFIAIISAPLLALAAFGIILIMVIRKILATKY